MYWLRWTLALSLLTGLVAAQTDSSAPQSAPAAQIPREAVGVQPIHLHRGVDGIGEGRLRIAEQAVQLQSLGQLLRARQRVLAEARLVFVVDVFRERPSCDAEQKKPERDVFHDN